MTRLFSILISVALLLPSRAAELNTLPEQTTLIDGDLLPVATGASQTTPKKLKIETLKNAFQPKDSDLSAIGALVTTTYGRGLLTDADSTATRVKLGLGSASLLAVGTSAGTVAAGNHTHSGVYEPVLGNPGTSGFVLSSTTGGVRSWIAPGAVGADLTAIEALSGTGYAKRTGADTWALASTIPFTDLTGTQSTLTNSAGLLAALSDETGTGAAVFAGGNIGAATATSINGLTLTTSTGTITIANAKTLTASNTLTLAGTDGSTLNIGTGGTLGTGAFAAAFNPAIPGAIGGTTPAAGTFTALTAPSLTSTGALALSAGGTVQNVTLVPSTTGVVEIRNGTQEQALQIYNTYTDASNYQRFAIYCTGAYYNIRAQAAGPGSFRDVTLGARILYFQTGASEAGLADRMQISQAGGASIGTATDPGAGNLLVKNVIYAKATSGALTPPTDSAGIRAKSDPAELYSVDEAGNETLLSPHAADAPAAFYDPADLMPHLVKEIQVFAATVRYQNFTRQGRLAELTSAERDALPIAKRRCVFVETFAQHLTRTGEDLNLGETPAEKTAWSGLTPAARWDQVQEKQRLRRVAEIAAWQAHKDADPAITEPKPATYAPKPKPSRLP